VDFNISFNWRKNELKLKSNSTFKFNRLWWNGKQYWS